MRGVVAAIVISSVALSSLSFGQDCSDCKRDIILAIVGDKNVTEKDLDAHFVSQIEKLQRRIFQLRYSAIQQPIDKHLLETEAAREKITVEELRFRIEETASVTEKEVEEYYLAHLAHLVGYQPDQAREKIRSYLLPRKKVAAVREFLTRVRSTAEIAIFVDPPERRRLDMELEENRTIGPRSPRTSPNPP